MVQLMKEQTLDELDVGKEVRNAPPAEPLLPVEKKLIAISLTLGIALLAILLVLTRL